MVSPFSGETVLFHWQQSLKRSLSNPIGAASPNAEKEECAVEHTISEESFRKMQKSLSPILLQN